MTEKFNAPVAEHLDWEMKKANTHKVCAFCGKVIKCGESYHWHLGDPYHDSCELSTGMICAGCGKSIRCGELYHRHLGRVYHDDCERDGEKKSYLHWTPSDVLREEIKQFRINGREDSDDMWEAIEAVNRRLDDHIDEEIVTVDIDGASELVAELVKIVRLYDSHKWVVLAGRYDTFAKAVDCHGDFYPVRFSMVDLLDELLCKYSNDWVRERIVR